MRILVIDNIDSFVYNLVQYVGIKGGDPVVLENTVSEKEVDDIVCSGIDRIIISPGPKAPSDAGISNYVIEKYGKNIPLLGVCLGHQCIGHVFGGEIRHAKTLMHGKTSEIKHDDSKLFSGLSNPFRATRYHSLVIDMDSMPSDLKVVATSIDDAEVMAVQHRSYPIFGVQFHPESIETKDGIKIIENFLKGVL